MKITEETIKDLIREERVKRQIALRENSSPEALRSLAQASDELAAALEDEEKVRSEREKEEERKKFQDDLEAKKKERSDSMAIKEQEKIDAKVIFETEARVTIDKKGNLKDVYTEIRAIEGVTVVSTEFRTVPVGTTQEKSDVRIKFIKGSRSLRHYTLMLAKSINRVDGVTAVNFVRTKKVV